MTPLDSLQKFKTTHYTNSKIILKTVLLNLLFINLCCSPQDTHDSVPKTTNIDKAILNIDDIASDISIAPNSFYVLISVKEFKEDTNSCYTTHPFAITANIKKIVNIGSSIQHNLYPDTLTTFVIPDVEIYELLKQNIEKNHIVNVTEFPCKDFTLSWYTLTHIL